MAVLNWRPKVGLLQQKREQKEKKNWKESLPFSIVSAKMMKR